MFDTVSSKQRTQYVFCAYFCKERANRQQSPCAAGSQRPEVHVFQPNNRNPFIISGFLLSSGNMPQTKKRAALAPDRCDVLSIKIDFLSSAGQGLFSSKTPEGAFKKHSGRLIPPNSGLQKIGTMIALLKAGTNWIMQERKGDERLWAR